MTRKGGQIIGNLLYVQIENLQIDNRQIDNWKLITWQIFDKLITQQMDNLLFENWNNKNKSN